MSIEQMEVSALAVVDAVGPDIIHLAPVDEHRFVPATEALLTAAVIWQALGGGIREGWQEWSKDKTVAVLDAIQEHIARRIRGAVPRAFHTDPTPETTRQMLADADQSLTEARSELTATMAASIPQVIETSVSTTGAALQALGLKVTVRQRVEAALSTELEVMFQEPRISGDMKPPCPQ